MSEEVRISYQGLIVEVTEVLQLNQGVCTDVLYPHPCLIFLCYFLCIKAKKVNRDQEDINEDKMRAIFKEQANLWSNVYSCLLTQKVTKKEKASEKKLKFI